MTRRQGGLWWCLMLGLGIGLGCGGEDSPTKKLPVETGGSGGGGLAGLAPLAGLGGAGIAPTPAGSGGSVALSGFAGSGGSAGSMVVAAGAGGMAGSGDMAGSGGMTGSDDMAGSGGMAGTDGTAGAAGMAGDKGACCADGNCLCHGAEPTALTSSKGPYATKTFAISTGTVHYPTDGEPPYAGVAICGGFLNTGPEMDTWGSFYASHGIVTVITSTGASDDPATRAGKLLAAIKELKAEGSKSGSPLSGKLSDRFGTSGYSMGGGGTTIASGDDKTLKTSVGLAAWGGSGTGVTVPTLLLCGASDTTAPCSMAQGVYGGIKDPTPKMMISIPGATHFSWFGPTDAGMGVSGAYALAFQKVFLEGDERWKPLLLGKPSSGTQTTNVK